MKHLNKGHELECVAQELLKNFSEQVFVFGAGMIGRDVASVIKNSGCKVVFIDNNEKKAGTYIDEKKVILFEEYQCNYKGQPVVIAVNDNYRDDIRQQLEAGGLIKGKHFFDKETFLNFYWPIIMFYHYQKLYVDLAQVSLTERCTLKCKKCAHACNTTQITDEDMTIQKAMESADSFFKTIDYCHEFVLIGGEPLLHKELDTLVEYLNQNYRDKIGILSITTNGTIVPGEKLLHVCALSNVLFRISNYSKAIPALQKNYEKITKLLEEKGISYDLGPRDFEWMDYGFESVEHSFSQEQLIKWFDACKTPCREINGSQFYYCVMAHTVSKNLFHREYQEEALNLDKIDSKIEFLEYHLGYSEKGYMEMCKRCNGAEAVNYPIPVAQQM